MAEPVRPALYVRVSTTEQADVGQGLAVQRQQGVGMAMLKQWAEPRIYEDAGLSGTLGSTHRPALAQLLRDVKAGRITVVIVASLDRLGRSTRIILDVIEQIEASGAALMSCRESLDTTTPTGRFTLTILAAVAQLDRDQMVKRMTDGRDSRGRRDGEKGGNVPLGYVRVAGVLTLDAVRAAVVRRVFTLRAQRSLRAIARELNRELVPTPHGGKVWYAATVRHILLHEAIYRGGTRGESSIPWPIILDDSVSSPPQG
jgi:site-specific DNA recombinase